MRNFSLKISDYDRLGGWGEAVSPVLCKKCWLITAAVVSLPVKADYPIF